MGQEQSKAFQQLKNYLAGNLIVTVPSPEAPLLLYVAASNHVVSAVLVQENELDTKVIQQPVYYISSIVRGKAKLFRN